MQKTWAANVYAYDKRTAEICRGMQETGFGFDSELAEKMRTSLVEKEGVAERKCCEVAEQQFNPRSEKQLKKLFVESWRAPIVKRSEKTGEPSFDVEVLRSYASHPDERIANTALAVLEVRRLRKVRSTYIDGKDVKPIEGRIHPTWLNYGTISGRPSCQAPNLTNTPRLEHDPTTDIHPGGIRALYIPLEGRKLVYFDASQIEMRVAAYASGDEVMIAACESSDLHAANAELIFEAFKIADYQRAKKEGGRKLEALSSFRSMAKQSGFAVCYLAEAQTVLDRLLAEGQAVKLRQVEGMLRVLHERFEKYFAWQRSKLRFCQRYGYVETPLLGRRRLLGHSPKPPECANFPIQGGASEVMGEKMVAIDDAIKWRRIPAKQVAYIYDSLTFEVEPSGVGELREVIDNVFNYPVKFGEREAVFPIEMEVLDRWH